MSTWTDFRDGIVDSLKFDEVTEELKEQFSSWLVETVMPLAHTAADSFITQTKAQAADEKGWCKVRDLIILPAVISIGLWAAEKALINTNVSAS